MLDIQVLRIKERHGGAQVVSTTRSGKMGHVNSGFLEKAQFQTMISTERDAVDYSFE
jgi:hypothetical protein